MELDFAKTQGGVLMPSQKLIMGGKFIGQIIRNGKVIDEFEDHNLVVNEGLNAMLETNFRGGTQITSWFLGIFEGNYTPVGTVTAATIVAASTECTAYTQSTRPAYTTVAAASQSLTNAASRGTYTFNATKTIYGAFLISNSAKSSTTGTLFSAARFGTAKNVESGDEMLLTYNFTASSI